MCVCVTIYIYIYIYIYIRTYKFTSPFQNLQNVNYFTKIRGIIKNACCCLFSTDLVSASDVTATDHWLNVWCICHTYLETLQECRSHHRIGWIIQDFRETCVSRSLTFRLEIKMLWCQTPSRKKKAVVFTNVTTSAYQDQLNAGSSKVCEIFKVCGIESLKYVKKVSHTGLVLWWHFHAPKRDAERNELWLVVWHVSQTASWPINAAISLNVWLRETSTDLNQIFHIKDVYI